MNFVADASLVVAALVDNAEDGMWAADLLRNGVAVAPEHLHVEATNVLRRLERAGHITRSDASAAFEDLMQLDLELFKYEPLATRVWELRHNVTSYDAWYVALAEALQLPLATLDRRLADADGPRCTFVSR